MYIYSRNILSGRNLSKFTLISKEIKKKITLLIIIYEFMLIINHILRTVLKIDINILGF